MIEVCFWEASANRDEDPAWGTACGEVFVMAEGTPSQNGYKFCPSCGREIHEMPF